MPEGCCSARTEAPQVAVILGDMEQQPQPATCTFTNDAGETVSVPCGTAANGATRCVMPVIDKMDAVPVVQLADGSTVAIEPSDMEQGATPGALYFRYCNTSVGYGPEAAVAQR